jgi:bacterioferritin-associated ferredoxin
MQEKIIVCRCEDISLAELREWLDRGYTDMEEIKRLTRAGMGPCQGRTCRNHIVREVAGASGKPPAGIDVPSHRPPVKPVSLKTLAGSDDNHEK